MLCCQSFCRCSFFRGFFKRFIRPLNCDISSNVEEYKKMKVKRGAFEIVEESNFVTNEI